MADEEKPYAPTPGRIAKARKEGNIAKSAELTGVASFAFGTIALVAVAPSIASASQAFIIASVKGPSPDVVPLGMTLSVSVLAVYLAAASASVVVTLVQTRGLAFVAPKFKPERMKPAEGLKRMFSMQSVVSAIKALLAFVVTIGFAIPTGQLVFGRGTGETALGPFAVIATVGAQRALASAILVAAFFAVADYLIVHAQWLKKLRMSLYEIRKEYKENEGDPRLKNRRKRRHRKMLSGPVASVAKASFVVANPTHVAVALQYAPPDIGVPLVLVMGVDENALRIRGMATELGIPVIENVPLARSLLATATVGKPIPRESFVAIAEIVTALFAPAAR